MSYQPGIDRTLAAAGLIDGWSWVDKFGCATDVDLNIGTDIWDGADGVTSTDIYVPPTDFRTHTVVSTAIADNVTGSGAREYTIWGLTDAGSGVLQYDSEVLTAHATDGTIAVTTTKAFFRIYRIKITDAGTHNNNWGIVTATATTDLTVSAAVLADAGQTQMAIYTVADGYELYIESIGSEILRSTATVAADINLWIRDIDAGPAGVERRIHTGQVRSDNSYDPPIGVKTIPARHDVWLRSENCTANNSAQTGYFNGYLRTL